MLREMTGETVKKIGRMVLKLAVLIINVMSALQKSLSIQNVRKVKSEDNSVNFINAEFSIVKSAL